MFRSFVLLILLGMSNTLLGQPIQTFSKTFIDTFALSSISGSCIEFNNLYYCAASGYGLNLSQGSYCQIVGVDPSGIVIKRLLSFTTQRTNWGGSPLGLTQDGKLVVALAQSNLNAYSPLGITVTAFTADLDTVWSFKNADSTQSDLPIAIATRNNKIYITGARNYLGVADPYMFDGFLLILNEDGSFVDFKLYHENIGDVYLMSIVPCIDGGFFLGGNTNLHGYNEGYLMKIDSLGNKVWDKVYVNYSLSYFSKFNFNKLIISGTESETGNYNGKLTVLDTTGEIIWEKTYDYETYFEHYISRKFADKIISVGLTNTSEENDAGYIACSDTLGNVIWQRRYNYNEQTDFFTDVIETSDGGLLINGTAVDTGLSGGGQNLWLIKLYANGCLTPNCWVGFEDVIENNLGIKVFPNPAKEWLNFKLPEHASAVGLEVFSISGKRVMHTKLLAPLEAIQVNHLPAGLYLLKFTLGDGRSVVEKVVLGR